jgi:hypothetical protein
MNTAFIYETARKTPVLIETDVVVAGAGMAAALAVKTGTTCRKVDIKKVQPALKCQGVKIQ